MNTLSQSTSGAANKPRHHQDGEKDVFKFRDLIFTASLIVLPAGCSLLKPAVNPHYPNPSTVTRSQALEGKASGDPLFARLFFTRERCKSAFENLDQCKNNKGDKTTTCEMASETSNTCYEIKDEIYASIDSLVNNSEENAKNDRFREAIKYIDQAVRLLDENNDTQWRNELSAKRAEYAQEIEMIKKAYSEKHETLSDLLKKQPYSDDDWVTLANTIETMRKDRNETEEQDPELFEKTLTLAKNFFKAGDYERSGKALKMATNVDLGHQKDSRYYLLESLLGTKRREALAERDDKMDPLIIIIENQLAKYVKLSHKSEKAMSLEIVIKRDARSLRRKNISGKHRRRLGVVLAVLKAKKDQKAQQRLLAMMQAEKSQAKSTQEAAVAKAPKAKVLPALSEDEISQEVQEIQATLNSDRSQGIIDLIRSAEKYKRSRFIHKFVKLLLVQAKRAFVTQKSAEALLLYTEILKYNPGNEVVSERKKWLEGRLKK